MKPHLPPMPLLMTGELLLFVTLEEKEGEKKERKKQTTGNNCTL